VHDKPKAADAHSRLVHALEQLDRALVLLKRAPVCLTRGFRNADGEMCLVFVPNLKRIIRARAVELRGGGRRGARGGNEARRACLLVIEVGRRRHARRAARAAERLVLDAVCVATRAPAVDRGGARRTGDQLGTCTTTRKAAAERGGRRRAAAARRVGGTVGRVVVAVNPV